MYRPGPVRGYRPTPPTHDALVEWPSDFGTRFAVFVDTEEEFDWSLPLRRENRATEAMRALPQTHRLFADHGVPANYMVDHPIATCPMAVDILSELLTDGRSAIGTQLHPWVNPPFDEAVTPLNSFAGNLPRALEAAKLSVLTQAIKCSFGQQPVMFRAGRYGIGPNSFSLLAAAGYRVDTSMRSRYDYSHEGGADFTAIGNDAFRTGQGDLIELPLTTIYTGVARAGGVWLHGALGALPKARAVAARTGMLHRVALTPEDMPIEQALQAIRVAVDGGTRMLLFSYHSPSAAPGYTPYVRSATDLRLFHRWWEAAFRLLDDLGVAPASHEQILSALDRTG